MMYYIGSTSTNPYFNLALEQYVFDSLDKNHSYFMLWQNHNSIIIGKHQNTIAEINAEYVKEHDISVARRLSGGGAVYHDLGNLNFTFITDEKDAAEKDSQGIDFHTFCRPVQKALAEFGVEVEISGRNDMTIDGKKFSGNSQYVKNRRIMHHGTLMYDSDLQVLSLALRVSKDKIESKGVQSIRSHVTNIRPYMKKDASMNEFWEALKVFMFSEYSMEEYAITPDDIREVEKLRDSLYSQWSWNFGKSPKHSIQKVRRVEGCGKIEIFLDIQKDGVFRGLSFRGDFFSKKDPEELAKYCEGCHYEISAVRERLLNITIADYFFNLDKEGFLSILFS